ncbi:MAG: UDP-N-acetylmuramate dehydrogenase [Planctomycetota bacterium]
MEWSRKWFEGFKGVVREGVSLAPYSHLRVGGKASVFLEPWSEEDAALALGVCREHGLPYYVLGGGSNLLIHDDGVDAVVFCLGKWNRVVKDENRLIASAGASLASLLRMAKDSRLSGLETLVGIPAQVGGAVMMNAGTVHGETFDRVESVRVIDERTELRTLERAELDPGYRDGRLGDVLVTTATFALTPGSSEEIWEKMSGWLKQRSQTQPVQEKSVGCMFKNPAGEAGTELSAGRLIDEAGMKGERVGDVEVSPKHANYFINHGEGTAGQMLELIDRVRRHVKDDSGIQLELEVKLWGF